MATTTNYSWTTPDDTALVKDGAAAIRSLGTAIDTTVFNNANAAIAKTIVDAKGDIIAATGADAVARLAVGSNDQVLTADSSTATGLKWATASAGGTYSAYTPTLVDITLGNGTMTARYCQIGKFVEVQVEILFGSTTSVTGGNPSISLPVTATASDYGIRGMAKYGDATGEEYLGMLDQRSTTTMHPRTCQVLSAKVVNYGVSSTQPFTWTTNDQITLFYVYEAA